MYVAVALLVSLAAISSGHEFDKPSPVPERNRQTRPQLSDRPDGKVASRKSPAGAKPAGTADRTAPKPAPSISAAPKKEQQVTSSTTGEAGIAGFFAAANPGARTASGELLDNNELIAAHPRYAFGSRVRITNEANGRTVVVRINDRCKADGDRIINVSRRAAEELWFIQAGTARVRIERLEQ